jgi:lysophospholipase L1-like esterase
MAPICPRLWKIAVVCLIVSWNPLAQAEEPSKILVKSGSKIAFMGDSITDQGWKHPTGYVKLIVNGLEANKIHVTPIPAGVSGNIAGQMRERLQKDVLDKNPDWLLLSCGINDVWHLREHKEDFDKYKQNITSLVEKALAAKVAVIILTTTVIGEGLNEGHNQTLVSYNQFLRTLAREKRCLLADVDADFREALKSSRGGTLTADGVHLNPHGDQMVADRVLKTFGFTQAQLDPLHETWRDIPDAWQLRANYDKGMGKMFLVQKLLTIRQYEQLQQIAAKKKRSVHEMVRDLHANNIATYIKPRGEFETYDAIFEKKRQGELQPRLQAAFDRQIRQILGLKKKDSGSRSAVVTRPSTHLAA